MNNLVEVGCMGMLRVFAAVPLSVEVEEEPRGTSGTGAAAGP